MCIEKWQQAIGSENVKADPQFLAQYTNNVSALERAIKAVLYPTSTEDVQKIVQIAKEHKQPLHPISSGKNWGLGSRLPVKSDAAIVDLAKLNKIHKVDTTHGYAVIEAGVTQKQLYEHLEQNQLPYMINVTGSGEDTTFIGNAMDRGIAYYFPRVAEITGLEVVLGNGQILHTGFGHYATSKITHLYPYGVGPSLDGLFFQSNFGIVTKVGLSLIAKPDYPALISFSLKDTKNLSAFIDAIANLRKRRIIDTTFHVSNRNRGEISLSPLLYEYFRGTGSHEEIYAQVQKIVASELTNPWTAVVGLLGTKAQAIEAYRQAKKLLAKIASTHLITDSGLKRSKKLAKMLSFLHGFRRKQILLEVDEPSYRHSQGVPSDTALYSVYWPVKMQYDDLKEPDQSQAGKLYTLPVVPIAGKDITQVVELVENIFYKKYQFTPYITFNMATAKSFESVINLVFDRGNKEQVNKAQQCIREINQAFVAHGYIPYRVGIQAMEDVIYKDEYWQLIAQLKQVFDPECIISPGRYNLV